MGIPKEYANVYDFNTVLVLQLWVDYPLPLQTFRLTKKESPLTSSSKILTIFNLIYGQRKGTDRFCLIFILFKKQFDIFIKCIQKHYQTI